MKKQTTLTITLVNIIGLGIALIHPALSQSSIQNQPAKSPEETQWQSLAKITTYEAKEAAEAALGGTATNVTLANRNGGLVYEVVFSDTKVIVDAGNGVVLYSERIALEDENKNASYHPRSSISIPDSDQYNETTEQPTRNLNSPSGLLPQRENADESDSRSRNRIQIPASNRNNENNTDQTTPNVDPPFGSVIQKPENADESSSPTESKE